MSHSPTTPPPELNDGHVVKISDGLRFQLLEDPYRLAASHWCTVSNAWRSLFFPHGQYTVLTEDPLTIDQPIHLTCCGTHGRVRDSQWEALREQPAAPFPEPIYESISGEAP